MKVIDKNRLDNLIELTREYFGDHCVGEKMDEILDRRTELIKDLQNKMAENAWYVGEFVASAVLMKRDVKEKEIYKMLGCIGYKVKEVYGC